MQLLQISKSKYSILVLIQVHELHRLYQAQQRLMGEMNTNKEFQRDPHHTTFELEHPAEKQDRNFMQVESQENNLELTLATGNRRLKKKATTLCSESGSSFSSSSSTVSATMKNQSDDQFRISEIDMRFKLETHRQSGLKHDPWFSQCLSLI